LHNQLVHYRSWRLVCSVHFRVPLVDLNLSDSRSDGHFVAATKWAPKCSKSPKTNTLPRRTSLLSRTSLPNHHALLSPFLYLRYPLGFLFFIARRPRPFLRVGILLSLCRCPQSVGLEQRLQDDRSVSPFEHGNEYMRGHLRIVQ